MKYFSITTLTILVLLALTQILTAYNVSGTPTVPYETLKKFKQFEIRQYPELTVASTELYSNSYKQNSRTGFRRIASYIFGNNKSGSKIAMTSPVQMNMGEDHSMSFFMPSDMQMGELPLPNNNQVNIESLPSTTVAVIEFSGWATDEKLKKMYIKLKSLLDDAGIQYNKGYKYLGYNPPYQFVNRRNEIIIELTDYHEL